MKIEITPRGLLVRAALFAAAFGVVHVLGWREETRFLSGTPSNVTLGVIYGFFYFAFVLGVPTLVIGAGVLAIVERVGRPPSGRSDATRQSPAS